jgi:hypothetical protein
MPKVAMLALVCLGAACASEPAPLAHSAPPAASSAAPVVDEGPPVHAPPGWRRFVAEDEGFSVYMPGVPVAVRGQDGKGPLLRATYKDRDTGCVYAVEYDELDPTYVGHPDELFAKLKDDPGPGLTLMQSLPTTEIDAPGRDLRFADIAADAVLAMRVYAVAEHRWIAVATFPREQFTEEAARAYLDTFRLTSSP